MHITWRYLGFGTARCTVVVLTVSVETGLTRFNNSVNFTIGKQIYMLSLVIIFYFHFQIARPLWLHLKSSVRQSLLWCFK